MYWSSGGGEGVWLVFSVGEGWEWVWLDALAVLLLLLMMTVTGRWWEENVQRTSSPSPVGERGEEGVRVCREVDTWEEWMRLV